MNKMTFTKNIDTLSLSDIKNAIKILEKQKASKEKLKKELSKVITYMANSLNISVYENEYLPANCIVIGTGKNKFKEVQDEQAK